jgi:hypothetical protein
MQKEEERRHKKEENNHNKVGNKLRQQSNRYFKYLKNWLILPKLWYLVVEMIAGGAKKQQKAY